MRTMTGSYIASVWLHCPKCGRTYTKRKECYNRKQAASWSSWMAQNYKGICPECYKSRTMA